MKMKFVFLCVLLHILLCTLVNSATTVLNTNPSNLKPETSRTVESTTELQWTKKESFTLAPKNIVRANCVQGYVYNELEGKCVPIFNLTISINKQF